MRRLLSIIVKNEDIRLLASSAVFNSFSLIKNLPHEGRLKAARSYRRSERQSKIGTDGVFDLEFYKARFPAHARRPANYLLHYIKRGWRIGLCPHVMFDIGYYIHEAEKKGFCIDVEPFEHYCKDGWRDNISPSMYFDNDWYVGTYMKHTERGGSPLEHFLQIGSENGYSTSPFFSMHRIGSALGVNSGQTLPILKIYMSSNDKWSAIDTHPLFDTKFYNARYPDVAQNNVSPLAHFTAYGLGERRVTMPLNDSPAGHANEIDRLQFKFVNYSDYFGTKEIFNRYIYLDKLIYRIGEDRGKDARRPLAIIAMYNDADCIEAVLRAAVREGLSLWLIDNWSTDATYEIISELASASDLTPYIDGIERFPSAGPSDQYDWHGILSRKQVIASQFPGRWILHQDSDEITTSLVGNSTCASMLQAIASLGYNAVNMRMFDFRPIDRSEPGPDIEAHFDYFEFSDKPGYASQLKAWVQPDTVVDLASSAGHCVQFGGIKAYPLRLPRKHYALRSVSHARRKITLERLPRFEKERMEKGWHVHYEADFDDSKFVWDRERLQLYTSVGHASVWFPKMFNDDFVAWS
ncbi:glycosyltransferase family 2 protein [Methylobacterium sp. J-043]|nr:glycosyltransferase family 2 protein [Methylobacterium sp. J-043]